ncbi:MAG: VWA domain-containing protein [Tenacibaculum sp.]
MLFVLKGLSLFFIGLLLLNLKIDTVSTENIKPSLAILADNSLSTKYFKETKSLDFIYTALKNNPQLNKKFSISSFSFGKSVKLSDSLSFDETETDIHKAISSVDEFYGKEKPATILITDGNQTTGNDYEFATTKSKIYPVVIGDTTAYQDIQIRQLNVNKYSYIKNKFPVEALVLYEGKEEVSTVFTLSYKGEKVYSQTLKLSAQNPVKTIRANLSSKKKGVQYYQAYISKLKNEKNTSNNYKNFSVEIIDQQTKILLLSSILHPDLGAVKKAIESNKQLKVTVEIVGDKKLAIEDYQMYICYQPNLKFKDFFDQVQSNMLIITGTNTDWNYLNSLKLPIKKNTIEQTEETTAIYNPSFLPFFQEDIGFGEFPPLEDKFGKLQTKQNAQILLYQQINGVATKQALLAGFENNGQRQMFLLGEGIWKWRATSFLRYQSFENFDAFIENIIQYLGNRKSRSRLEVKAKNIYRANSTITFSAFYTDKNYRFDKRASLELKITDINTQNSKTVPFILTNNSYQVSVEALPAGDYSYQVSVVNQAIKKTGKFKISPYQIEEQFTHANTKKLQRLANKTKGRLYYKNQVEKMLKDLLTDTNYYTVQKQNKIQKNLIDQHWILILIVMLLSLEWFLRKYYGKI